MYDVSEAPLKLDNVEESVEFEIHKRFQGIINNNHIHKILMP